MEGKCDVCGAVGTTCCKTAVDRLATADSLANIVDRQSLILVELKWQLDIMLKRSAVDATAWHRDDAIRQQALGLVRRVSLLNKTYREIGAGMLTQLVEEAQAVLSAAGGGAHEPFPTAPGVVHCHTPVRGPATDFVHASMMGCQGCDGTRENVNSDGYCKKCASEQSSGGE